MNLGFVLPERCAASLREMFDYWNDRRHDRPCPSRRDLDPVDIPRLLPFVSLVNVRPVAPRFVYRLMGTSVVSYIGRDLTGAPVGTGVKPDELDAVLARYDTVAETMKPFYHQSFLQEESNDFSRVERLMLPLSEDGRSINMIWVHFHPWPR